MTEKEFKIITDGLKSQKIHYKVYPESVTWNYHIDVGVLTVSYVLVTISKHKDEYVLGAFNRKYFRDEEVYYKTLNELLDDIRKNVLSIISKKENKNEK